MSVPKNKRKQSKLEVHVKTETLLRHTALCVSNKKYFPDAFYDIITKEIVSRATQIHLNCLYANEIRVNSVETRRERRNLQDKAVQNCKNLKHALTTAKIMLRLSAKKVKYWNKLVNEALDIIKMWRDSDDKRYSEYNLLS